MNIGIDIDDTISETFEILIPYSQKYTTQDLKREAVIDLKKRSENHFYIEGINGWSREEYKEFWRKYYPEMMEQVNIKKFASEVINKLNGV